MAFLLLAASVNAQTGKVYPNTGIKKGVLKNGLTYYLYHNPGAQGKVNFYLVQDVGAILEEDNQAGLAHFLEHMCFNGTQNFPGNAIMEKFSAKGLTYNINAYTGIDQTVYHFTNIPSNDRAFCDECILILYDWCHSITLAPDRVEAERPVILEEMRTRNNLNFRLSEQASPVLYNHSKFADRNIIGPAEVIKNFTRDELIDFYHAWYRTDLQAIVIVGDIDVIETEEKVRNLFSTLPPKENPKERYHISIPDNSETYYKEIRDANLKEQSVQISFRHDYTENTDNNFMGVLLNGMLQKRVAKLLKDDKDKDKNAGEKFVRLSLSFAPIQYGYGNYTIDVAYHEGKAEEALQAALGMQKDVLENGFTEEEFTSFKEKLQESLKNLVNARNGLSNDYHFENIKKNFISKVDLLDEKSNLKAFQKLVDGLTLADLQAELNRWYSGPNKSILVKGDLEDSLMTKQQVLDCELNCKAFPVIPGKDDDDDQAADESQLAGDSLEGSEVVASEKIADLVAEKWTLANGATVVFKECNFTADGIVVYATSPGGLSNLNGTDWVNGMVFTSFAPAYGVNGYSQEQFENLLKTKQIQSQLKIGQRDEEVVVLCKYAEVETAFQLLYGQFTSPEIYSEKFDKLYADLGVSIKQTPVTYKTMLSDTIALARYGADRYHPVDSSWFAAISQEQLQKVYADRFQDAGNFTFYIIGGIGSGKAKKLAEKYIGSLPTTGRNETATLIENRLGPGRRKQTCHFDIPGNQAGVVYNLDMAADFTFKNNICFAMMKSYLQEQLHNEIRQKNRGTYGVQVSNRLERATSKNCNFEIRFECDPERAEELDDILHESLVSICENGISPEDFEVLRKKFDQPQGMPMKNNQYYLNILKDYVELGTNNDEKDFFKNTLDSVDRDYMNEMLKELIANAAILDLVYMPR
ncbi:zinc protease [Mangrovibacterium diazotrophicum]|uniref:Zinc protease n=1 Tax=Mangrovibacterium diazotrophicum TaxID=1261403 RepID=A0A419VUS1_9BACT|nr:zinc protease [Mangrovibacterium diazotrophicum]